MQASSAETFVARMRSALTPHRLEQQFPPLPGTHAARSVSGGMVNPGRHQQTASDRSRIIVARVGSRWAREPSGGQGEVAHGSKHS